MEVVKNVDTKFHPNLISRYEKITRNINSLVQDEMFEIPIVMTDSQIKQKLEFFATIIFIIIPIE